MGNPFRGEDFDWMLPFGLGMDWRKLGGGRSSVFAFIAFLFSEGKRKGEGAPEPRTKACGMGWIMEAARACGVPLSGF